MSPLVIAIMLAQTSLIYTLGYICGRSVRNRDTRGAK